MIAIVMGLLIALSVFFPAAAIPLFVVGVVAFWAHETGRLK